MCYALFIAADEPLGVENEIDAEGRFHIEALQEHHSVVVSNFSKPHVYYAASWQGCGCGWFRDLTLFERKKTRVESRRKTEECVRALGLLVRDLLERNDSVELFLGWEGELEEGVSRRIALTPTDFDANELPLKQGDLAVVKMALG